MTTADDTVDSDSSLESESAESAGQGVVPEGGGSMKEIRLVLFIAAGMAVLLAIGALLLGQRRSSSSSSLHSLSGSVARRISLFGHLCTAQSFRCDRPPRHVETPMSKTTISNDYEIMEKVEQEQQHSPPQPQSASV
jgi:hypothetical protein